MQNRLWRNINRQQRTLFTVNPTVFIGTTLLIFGFVILSLIFLKQFANFASELQTAIATQFGWLFVLTVNLILGYLVFLAISPFGNIRLGGEDAKPEFSRLSWFTMLFSAGMGIGLMFYSIAEPMYHLSNPPHGAEAHTLAAYQDAVKTTFLHWGLHAWGIYTLMALGLAYFAFNHNQPLSIRSIFEPLLGERIYGWPGHIIDIIAAVATLFGVATSLGLGVSQINTGLNHIFNISVSSSTQIMLIAFITSIATLSVVLGINKGIKRLSEANLFLAMLLLLFVLILGPTLFILNGFVENIGLYLNDFFQLSFWNETYTQGSWQNGWTVFYWGWWIAWAPFVGMFIARISKGRTIRELIASVLLVATLFTFIWLTVFGNSALYIELNGPGGLADAVTQDLTRSLFVFIEQLPAAGAWPRAPRALHRRRNAVALHRHEGSHVLHHLR